MITLRKGKISFNKGVTAKTAAGFELDDMYVNGQISEDDWKYQAVLLLLADW